MSTVEILARYDRTPKRFFDKVQACVRWIKAGEHMPLFWLETGVYDRRVEIVARDCERMM